MSKQSDKIATCFKILKAFKPEEPINLTKIKERSKLCMSDFELKQHIMYIRANMVSKFQNPTGKIFLIENEEGYRLTSSVVLIYNYWATVDEIYKSTFHEIKEISLALYNHGNNKN